MSWGQRLGICEGQEVLLAKPQRGTATCSCNREEGGVRQEDCLSKREGGALLLSQNTGLFPRALLKCNENGTQQQLMASRSQRSRESIRSGTQHEPREWKDSALSTVAPVMSRGRGWGVQADN